MTLLAFLFAGLWTRKLRALLSLAAIAALFALHAYLSAVDHAFDGEVSVAGEERILVRHKASLVLPLPRRYHAAITTLPGVADATYASWLGGVYREGRNAFPQLAVDPPGFLAAHPAVALGEAARARWRDTPNGAVIGATLAARFGWGVGDRVPLDTPLWPRRDASSVWTFRIVGVYDTRDTRVDTRQFLIRHDFFDATRDPRWADRVGWFVVRVENPREAVAVASRIDRHFAHTVDETHSEPEGAFVRNFVAQIGDVGRILRTVFGAAFATALWMGSAALSREVRARRRVVGLLKALGWSDAALLGQVVGWLCGACLLAAGLGFGLGAWLVAAGDPSGGALPHFAIPPGAVHKAAGWALALGVVSSLWGGYRVRRIAPALTLRDGLR